uniref:Uncharacterized protein n=1 Tax=Utricularia reniformis TaxID=192314 RepID=A0A1Y0AZN5_9LAMI|nr:hypothetical protein AEK19_MT0331 [Utricularia reniformis]ART30604.1 hypothetical protein AEK19_MT0331 [Utricularia reniformis]
MWRFLFLISLYFTWSKKTGFIYFNNYFNDPETRASNKPLFSTSLIWSCGILLVKSRGRTRFIYRLESAFKRG